MDENTRRLAQFLLSDDARTRRQRQNLALAGYDTSGYQPTFGPSDSSPEQAGPEVGPMRRSPVNPIVAGPDQASFLTSEKDTRPHWETDQRSMLMPLVMSGYNNSVSYGVPSFFGGHAWSTMGDIVKGNAVHPDEIAHSANDAAGAAMLGSMPMGAARGGVSLGSGGGRSSQPPGFRAYHGSPQDFDRFDMSKIGTGEGAQAFGHGLYFAENEGVAKSYRTAGAPAWMSTAIGGRVQNAIAAHPTDMKAARQSLHDAAMAAQSQGERQMLFDAYNNFDEVAKSGTGHMYEVNIKADPNDFLDLNKPLKQQSEGVRSAIERVKKEAYSWPSWGDGQLNEAIHLNYAPAEASAKLRDAGIPGIKYLDQGSRGAGEGSRNYVVFDDKLIEILRKYGLAGILAGGYAMTGQEPQE